MKNVEFTEVGMKNYGPYVDPMILKFENNKLTLISGPNGIGKTMSLDAIPFALYGITSKGARGDDVVNNQTGKNCKVWVNFKINEEEYKVTRYHKYSKFGNTVILNQNGVDIKKGHKEVLPLIERLICPQKAFMNALMFGQKVKDFFTDLPDSQKKEIFRKVLDLEMFLVYYKFADLAFKDIEKASHELNNKVQVDIGLLANAKNQIELLKKSMNEFEKKKEDQINEKKKVIEESKRLLKQWTENLEKLKDKDINLEDTVIHLAEIEKSLKELASVYMKRFSDLDSQKQTKILELKNKAQTAKENITKKYNDILNNLQEKRSDLKQKLNDLITEKQNEKHKLELEETEFHSRQMNLEDKVQEIKSNVIDADISSCPTCKQEISDETKEILKKQVKSFEDEIENIEEAMKNISNERSEINKVLVDESKKIHENISNVDREKKETTRAMNDEYEQIERKLHGAITKVIELAAQEHKNIVKDENNESNDLTEQKSELIERKKIQEKNLDEIKTSEENIKNINYDIKNAERQIEEINETKYDKTQYNSYLMQDREYSVRIDVNKKKMQEFDSLKEIASFWKTGFSSSGIPSMLIDEAVPYMNEKVEYYLDLLTNGRYIVSFDTLAETKSGEFRDKISVRVLDTQTRANSRVQLSGGQIRIIDIAIILTLGDLLSRMQDVSFNILLLDEIFDALDEQNIQYVSKVLSKIKIGKAIYVISHGHQDHLEADETLAFT